eukprot:4998735-Amphidinium_carterae.2
MVYGRAYSQEYFDPALGWAYENAMFELYNGLLTDASAGELLPADVEPLINSTWYHAKSSVHRRGSYVAPDRLCGPSHRGKSVNQMYESVTFVNFGGGKTFTSVKAGGYTVGYVVEPNSTRAAMLREEQRAVRNQDQCASLEQLWLCCIGADFA